jgi:hypothetical protein
LSPDTKSSLDKLCKELNVGRSIFVDRIISETLKAKIQKFCAFCPKCGQIIAFDPTPDASKNAEN